MLKFKKVLASSLAIIMIGSMSTCVFTSKEVSAHSVPEISTETHTGAHINELNLQRSLSRCPQCYGQIRKERTYTGHSWIDGKKHDDLRIRYDCYNCNFYSITTEYIPCIDGSCRL